MKINDLSSGLLTNQDAYLASLIDGWKGETGSSTIIRLRTLRQSDG